jgi:hypothetical protein
MTEHKLLRMIEEAGFDFTPDIMNKLQKFQNLIWVEREECASIEVHLTTPDRDYTNISPLDAYEAALMDAAMAFREAIRARGQHED